MSAAFDSLQLNETQPLGPAHESLDLGSFSHASPSDSAPTRVALPQHRFRVLEILGTGGHGTVARAEDLTLDRQVAVKWLRPGPQDTGLLLQEARAQASLEHPHICRIYDTGHHEGSAYIVMQLVEGQPITQALKGRPLREKLTVLRMAAEAVHAAHRGGLIHRDLKPGNLLVERTPEGRPVPRLLDFGLATRVEDLRRLHAEGLASIAGTPAYMAPEQTLGAGMVVDQRADIWALGVILYELVLGALPFRITGGLDDLLAQQAEGVPDPWDQDPILSADLRAILLKALARHPWDRYPTAQAFACDLSNLLAECPVDARPVRLLERMGMWGRRHRLATSALVLGVFAVLAGATFGMVNRAHGQAAFRAYLHVDSRARALEQRLDQLHQLPPEHLGTAYSQLRLEGADLERQASQRPEWEQAPAHAILGRMQLALGNPERARQHYLQADRLGFRTSETGLGLGLALADLVDLGCREVASLPAPFRDPRIRALRNSLGAEARTLLRRHRDASGQPELVDARLLILEDRSEEAERLLAAHLARAPWANASRRRLAELRTQAPLGAGLPERETALLAFLKEAAVLAPGDPLYPLCEARLHVEVCRTEQATNRLSPARIGAAEAAVRRALERDPDLQEAQGMRSELSTFRASLPRLRQGAQR